MFELIAQNSSAALHSLSKAARSIWRKNDCVVQRARLFDRDCAAVTTHNASALRSHANTLDTTRSDPSAKTRRLAFPQLCAEVRRTHRREHSRVRARRRGHRVRRAIAGRIARPPRGNLVLISRSSSINAPSVANLVIGADMRARAPLNSLNLRYFHHAPRSVTVTILKSWPNTMRMLFRASSPNSYREVSCNSQTL
jgi:hypothetical protein